MAKVKVKMNNVGARQVMNSPGVQDDLLRRVRAIKRTAESIGTGKYAADVQPGRTRAHAMVKTTDTQSQRSNHKHNTLLKSLGSGR